MTDILDEIIAHKRLEIEQQKAAISQELLINNCNEPMPRRSMRASLSASPSGIIAEFKRRSPSKGWIKENAQADIISPAYEMAGASVLSILTDENFFGGNLKDIRAARPQVSLPILRKDFIIDEYQLYQACIVAAIRCSSSDCCGTQKRAMQYVSGQSARTEIGSTSRNS